VAAFKQVEHAKKKKKKKRRKKQKKKNKKKSIWSRSKEGFTDVVGKRNFAEG